ncbi:hypothetical protein LZ32DRAFT_233518 [Colletotrichum eremochloae]|nr:hypothetical protein LZ32DRAFT_233518 [Colletotrichum eremochloae]
MTYISTLFPSTNQPCRNMNDNANTVPRSGTRIEPKMDLPSSFTTPGLRDLMLGFHYRPTQPHPGYSRISLDPEPKPLAFGPTLFRGFIPQVDICPKRINHLVIGLAEPLWLLPRPGGGDVIVFLACVRLARDIPWLGYAVILSLSRVSRPASSLDAAVEAFPSFSDDLARSPLLTPELTLTK